MRAHVLSIGQCTPDDAGLARMLALEADAHLDRAQNSDDARRLISQRHYDLVLVNRLLDGDGSSGVALIGQLSQEPNMPPLMLVSDHHSAQEEAVKNGAQRGFGKSALLTPETGQLLRQVLHSDASADHT